MKEIDFVAGFTIKDALSAAHRAAVSSDEPVAAIINDIVMIVDKDTNIDKALADYRNKNKFRYEIEEIKREKQR